MEDTIPDVVWAIGSTRHSDQVLLAPERAPSTGRDLTEHVRSLADSIRRAGVGQGEVVASVLPNGPEAVTAFLAATSVGVAAPLNPRFRASELQFYLDDLRPSLVIVPDDTSTEILEACAAASAPVMSVRPGDLAGSVEVVSGPSGHPAESTDAHPDDVALVLHTSGTTSRPKMVPLTHRNLTTSATNVATTLRLGESDRCLNVMPLFHIHGLVAALLATLKSGGSLVASPGYLATEFFGWMEEFQPSWYTAVPTIHQSILERSRRPHGFRASANMRFIRSSSASLPPAVMQDLESTFGVPVVEAYGMTEAAHQISCNPLPPAARTPGSVGLPAGPEVAILGEDGPHTRPDEEGEVLVKGPNVTSGYLGAEHVDGAFVDGWFRTGDIGAFDHHGYLRLTGRSKEMINRAGETIAPREIDEALLQHDAVAQALAFGVPDRRLGEQPAAAVVLVDGHDVDEITLRRWVEERLSTAKVPRTVVFLDEIPTGPTGKLQRIGMAERLGLSDLDDAEAVDVERVPPRTRTEEIVLDVWREVLDRSDLGVKDRFLDVGGDSMLAMRLLARIRDLLGIDPSVVEFFDRATVESQAELIDERLLEDD